LDARLRFGALGPLDDFYACNDASHVYLAAGFTESTLEKAVWRSGDAGATWSNIQSSPPWSVRFYAAFLYNPGGNYFIMMGGNTGSGWLNDVYTSSDAVTWSNVNNNPGWSQRELAGAATVYHSEVFIIGGWNNNVFYNDVWTDRGTGGVTWTQIFPNGGGAGLQPLYRLSLIPTQTNLLIIAGQYSNFAYFNTVYSATDGGSGLGDPGTIRCWDRTHHYFRTLLLRFTCFLLVRSLAHGPCSSVLFSALVGGVSVHWLAW
jgi:hypothetical protein